MARELDGKSALVTGSSRGIGRAIAAALHAEGCRVVVHGRTGQELDVVAKELHANGAVTGDLTQPAEARRVMDETLAALGTLDILVCNVGGGASVPPGQESPEEWQRVFALNLWSATNTVEAASAALARSAGAIVCISSICGQTVVPGAPVTYSAAKAALHAYVRGIARPLAEQHVRINAIAAGNILHSGSVWARRLQGDPSSVSEMLARDVPLGRLGTPEDVADLAVYLASPRAAFATGGVWTLDGGQVRS